MVNAEKNKSPETKLALEELRDASREGERRIQERLERQGQHEKDTRGHDAEQALHEVERHAQERERSTAHRENSPEKRQAVVASKRKRTDAYNETMSAMRTQLSPGSRAFSKVIHNPAVEAVSEAAGKTIARPNAILAGSICAFVVVLSVYLIARYFGYPLSGFETIAAFILGWVIGIVFDFLKAMITGSR